LKFAKVAIGIINKRFDAIANASDSDASGLMCMVNTKIKQIMCEEVQVNPSDQL
jgi:hypothetical protein